MADEETSQNIKDHVEWLDHKTSELHSYQN